MTDLIRRGGEEEPEKRKEPEKKREEGGFRIAGAPVKGSPAGGASPSAPPRPSATRKSALEEGDKEGRKPVSLSERSGPRRCPHLGGRSGREKVLDYPTTANVCYAQKTVEKGLLRTKEWPYALISVVQQREYCLGAYARCEFYRRKEEERAPSDSPASAPPGSGR